MTANYGGDSNHNGGSGSVSQTVDQVSTTTAVASSLNPSEYGQAVSFSATVTGASPTGTVQFYIDGSLFDTETLASGTATSVSTSALTAGTYTVTATYSGDTNNTGSSGTLAGGQVVNAVELNHSRNFHTESVDVRNVSDVYGDDHHRHRRRQRAQACQEERHEPDAADRNGNLECEHWMRREHIVGQLSGSCDMYDLLGDASAGGDGRGHCELLG